MSAETLGRKYWNRRGNIQIEGYGDVLSGLDFKFEIKKVGNLRILIMDEIKQNAKQALRKGIKAPLLRKRKLKKKSHQENVGMR